MNSLCSRAALLLLTILASSSEIFGLQNAKTTPNQHRLHESNPTADISRRNILGGLVAACGAGALLVEPTPAWSAAAVQDSLDVDAFLSKGVDLGGTMGVSSQAGKSRPETGVYLRDGSEVSRNKKSGDVSAEIVVNGVDGQNMAVFVGYSSPWQLGKEEQNEPIVRCLVQR